jgi:hypothetical protein
MWTTINDKGGIARLLAVVKSESRILDEIARATKGLSGTPNMTY